MADKVTMEAQIDSNIGEVSEGIDKAAKSTENLEKSTKKASTGVKKLSVSFGNLLKAAGIVALLNKAFEIFKDVMSKNQGVMDGFNVAIGAMSIAFNDLFKFISDNVGPITESFKALFEDPQKQLAALGDAIKTGLIDRFHEAMEVGGLVAKAFGKLIKGDFSGAIDTIGEAGKQMVDVYTGVDDSFEDVKTAIVDYTSKVIDLSKAQVQANKDAEIAAIMNAKLNAQYLKEAEDLRQIRDNVNLTFKERMEANDKLNGVLEKQQALQKDALQTEMNALQLAFNNNASDENKIALMQKEVEMLQLEEAINGQMSEQKTNAIALENELRDAKSQTLLAGLEGMELELEELKLNYEEQVRLAKLAGEETTAIDEKYAKDKNAITQKSVKQQKKWSEMSQKQQLSIAGNTAGNLSKIMGEETEAGKAFAVTQATIDTYVGATAAYSSMAGIPIVGPVLGGIAAAAAIVAGIQNVKAITSASSSGPSGGGAAPSTTTSAPAPQMMSGEFNLAGGIEPEPVKTFVVTDEMTSSQNQLANIRRTSTI
tara:strand:- start:3153 stop:4775 length:1623 start_codon:yes stop_codon:yes gene_type:complete